MSAKLSKLARTLAPLKLKIKILYILVFFKSEPTFKKSELGTQSQNAEPNSELFRISFKISNYAQIDARLGKLAKLNTLMSRNPRFRIKERFDILVN